MRIDADALDALRNEKRGLILAANHPTLLDAMIMAAHVPHGVCVMRADLMCNVFLGPGRAWPATSPATAAAGWYETPSRRSRRQRRHSLIRSASPYFRKG